MRLSELVDFNPSARSRAEKLVPFVDMAALPQFGRDIRSFVLREPSSTGSRFANGDTLVARITPCLENGKGAQIRTLPEKTIGQGSTEFIVLRAKQSSDADFIYYVSRYSKFRDHAIKQMTGTSGRQRVAWQSIADYELPDLQSADRQWIGFILGALDDKIELNRRTNETLEAMARAIFKDWFVDFGPTRAKMEGREAYLAPDIWSLFPDRLDGKGKPEGWLVAPLSSLVQVNPSEQLHRGAEAPYLDMAALPTAGPNAKTWRLRAFTSGTRFRNGDTLLARITPCLENGKTALVHALLDDEVGWGSTEFIVMRARTPVSRAVPYLIARDPVFRAHAIRSMTGTSGRQRASTEAIASYKVTEPDTAEIWKRFAEVTDPMFARIAANDRENHTLAATRDLLLPKLMSGEIRIGAAEKIAGEAT